jgi:hypothetical protein
MEPEGYRERSADGMAASHRETEPGYGGETIQEEPRQLIDGLRAQLVTRAALARVTEEELRRQLAESEQMRAAMSQELQAVREQLAACAAGAADSVRRREHLLSAWSASGLLKDAGVLRLARLREWLQVYADR